MTITGSSFQTGATVTFGAVAAQSVNVVSPTSIIAVAPPAPATEQQAVGSTSRFATPTRRPPRRAGIPLHGRCAVDHRDQSEQRIECRRNAHLDQRDRFTSALAGASVTFGGVAGTNLTVTDAATLTVKTPAHANGTVDVVLTLGGHSVTVPGGFSFDNSPARRRGVKR